MRTGEVEKLTEVKEANIKFYEREGLINPRRNENGYRDFSDEDVKIINRIKTLRMLDVPIPEIKKLFDGDVQLKAVLEERLSEMNLQAKALDNRMESCRRIIKEGMELADISPEVLSGNREEWLEKLRHIVDEDIDKRFILKGVAFTAAFAVCVKFTVVVLTMGGFSQQDTQQDTVFCFFGGMLAILCGFVYIFCGSLDQAGFLVCVGKELGRVRNGRTCQFVFDSRHRGWFGRNHVAALGRPADCVHCPFCNYPNGADACNKRSRASEMKARQMNMMRRRRPGRLFFFLYKENPAFDVGMVFS